MVYKFLLLLLEDIVGISVEKKKSISFDPNDIQPGIAYNPKNIQNLSLATNGICNDMFNLRFNFSLFENLTSLDLSLNNITDMKLLCLQRCHKLVSLDLHRNNILNSFEEVCLFLYSFYKPILIIF